LIIASISSFSCEICGCGLGNYYIGLMPQFKNKFIGLRYQFHQFQTRLSNDPTQFSRDFYQTVELWSGWRIGKKFQVLAFVPYNINHQVSDEGTSDLKGLGDVALLVSYELFNKVSKSNPAISQDLWVGTGVKLPTGQFAIEPGDPDVASLANTQRGSGSTDIMFNGMYNLRISKWGFTANAGYKLNGYNKDRYQFGDKFSAAGFIYYGAQVSKTHISPNIGLLYEHNSSSTLNEEKIELTGGSLLQLAPGAEINIGSMALGFNVQLPVSQRFAEGQTQSRLKGMLHVTFAL
jgi:Putative MetA-pathway of phenol degradation